MADRHSGAGFYWNRIPDPVRQLVVDTALAHPEASPRELAWQITDTQSYFISESSVYRILKRCDLITSPAYIVLSARDRFQHPTRQVNDLWQTDLTYFRVVGWGWYYLSTVLDDYSRYIIAWKLFQTMAASDVQETLDLALEATGVAQVQVRHRPRLLSDNGPCYVSHELKDYLRQHGLAHTRGAPYHPMTQGKIERYHRSMKNVVKLENYYYPWELEQAIRSMAVVASWTRSSLSRAAISRIRRYCRSAVVGWCSQPVIGHPEQQQAETWPAGTGSAETLRASGPENESHAGSGRRVCPIPAAVASLRHVPRRTRSPGAPYGAWLFGSVVRHASRENAGDEGSRNERRSELSEG